MLATEDLLPFVHLVFVIRFGVRCQSRCQCIVKGNACAVPHGKDGVRFRDEDGDDSVGCLDDKLHKIIGVDKKEGEMTNRGAAPGE